MRISSPAVSSLLVWLFSVLSPSLASAQTSSTPPGAARFSVQAGGGPTLKDPGSAFSAGAGVSPDRHVDLVVSLERIHQPTHERRYSDGVVSVTRGGTLTFVSAEVRASLCAPDRVSPFVLAGFGGGTSRPNVNAQFPTPVRHDLRVVFAGAGVRVPLGHGWGLLADARLVLGVEDADGLGAAWPARAAIVWRF